MSKRLKVLAGHIVGYNNSVMRNRSLIVTPLGVVLIEAESNGEISLSEGELPRSIENGMTIDRSIACVLHVNPTSNATDVVFSASLKNTGVEGFPAPGECLDCIEFNSDDWHLTFGTEDWEMLNVRLSYLNIPECPYPITYGTSRMVLHLTGMVMKKAESFHMIISYKKLPDERDCTAWYFADATHETAVEAVKLAD